MKIPSNILHDKQYADKILEITADTMFFVYKDGTCLDFKANTTDFFIKEQDIIGRNIFSYFPVETAREMYAEFIKVRAGDKPSARNYKLILEDDVKYYKCIISKYDEEHFLFQYRDITGRSVVRLKLEKKQKDLCEVEKAARIGLWAYDSSTRLFTYSGYTRIFCNDEEQKQISIDEYMNYMHLDDKDRFDYGACFAFWVAIHWSTRRSSRVSGNAPPPSTLSWKPLMSNLSPSSASAFLRSSWMRIMPIL